MPTYQNDGSVTYAIVDINGDKIDVRPGDTIETFEDLSSYTDLTETAATPTLKATIASGEANTYVGPVKPKGYMNISVSGDSWTGDVLLQRVFSGEDYLTVSTYTSNTETSLTDTDPETSYRLGTVGLSAGSVVVELNPEKIT